MRKVPAALLLSVVLISMPVLARAGGHGRRAMDWGSVEGLVPGALIEVLPVRQAGPDLCRVSAVDDAALTCLREGAADDVRLVFPRGAVGSVWVVEPGHDRHVGLWIAMGLGFFLGAGLCAELGPGGIAVCGFAGAGIAAGAVLDQGPGWRAGWQSPFPAPPPRPPRMQRRLIYRAAAMASQP